MAVKEGKTRVTVTLDAEQLERVQDVALERGTSLSGAIAWIINDQNDKASAAIWLKACLKTENQHADDMGELANECDDLTKRCWAQGFAHGLREVVAHCREYV